jgi:peptidoglycan/xylan/chitin deacetylase (PgdA/CDA1 family)
MTWPQADAMARSGIEIGCHSLSHRSLGLLAPEQLDIETRVAKQILERQLGKGVETFAYPFGSEAYGDFDARVEQRLRAAGYQAACTTVVGTNAIDANAMALRRIPVEEHDGPFRIRCKLVGAYDWVRIVKDRWQRVAAREERVDAGYAANTN